MADMIWVASPEGKTEEHTPQNARDLQRNAGWKVVGSDEDQVDEKKAAADDKALKVKAVKDKAAAKAKAEVAEEKATEVKKAAPAKKAVVGK